MSEIKNVGLTWMALNTLKSNHLTPLRYKGLKAGQAPAQKIKCSVSMLAVMETIPQTSSINQCKLFSA